jgi:hypothetical protein
MDIVMSVSEWNNKKFCWKQTAEKESKTLVWIIDLCRLNIENAIFVMSRNSSGLVIFLILPVNDPFNY